MRRVLGTWAGDQAEVSKGAGAGQGHKQLAEVRLRSCQNASPVRKARAGAGLGAPPEESPPPRPGSEPASPPPTLGTRRLCHPEEWAPGPAPRSHLGQQAAEAWQGRPVAEAAPAAWRAPGASPP